MAAQRLHRPSGGLESLPLWQNGLPHLLYTWTIFMAAGVHSGAQVIPSGPLLPAGVQARSEALLPGVCPATGSLYPTQGGPLVNPLLQPGPPKSNSTPSSPRSSLSRGKRDFATRKRPSRRYGTDIAQFQKMSAVQQESVTTVGSGGFRGFPGGSGVKHPPAMQETLVQSLGGEDPWRRAWQPTLVFLPGGSYGQRSLVSNSPWGCKELDTTEATEPTGTCAGSRHGRFPPVTRSCGRGLLSEASGLNGLPRLSRASTPKPESVCSTIS